MKRIILFLFFSVSLISWSQDTIKTLKTPKVGLVLSGGGAKGLAHVGVLKVLDSLNVKIDYIAGTSMGAIVGSLYASGYSGKQLDSIFKKVNFDAIINDGLPREAKTFYERDNSERYAITLPIKDYKVKLPSALSRGQNSYNLLSKLLIPVNQINDFSKLPIPFLCVATNIETGKSVVLEKGQLAESVKASGALPTVFQPVYINGEKLIDGGVVNNFPIDELKAKGMDFIIGVDVQDDLAKKEDVNSALDILLQISNFRVSENIEVKIKKADIYIKPDVTGYSVISFDDGNQIEKNGEEATILLADKIKKLTSFQKNKPREPLKVQALDSIKINGIDIDGLNNYTSAYVLGKLRLKAGKKISYDAFIKGLDNLVATNNFDEFNYTLKPSNNEEGFDFFADATETKATTFLKLGIHYDNVYKTALLANLTKKQLLFKNDVLSFDIGIGENFRYDFEYYIDKGFYWSIGLKSRFNQFNTNIVNEQASNGNALIMDVEKIDLNVRDITSQFYVQTLFKNDFSVTLGAEHKYYNLNTETIIQGSNDRKTVLDNTNYFSLYGGLKLDTYDNKYFPKKGVFFNGDIHWYFKSSNKEAFENITQFSIARAELGYAFKLSNKFSVNVLTKAGFKINSEANQSLDFFLGGYGNKFINNFNSFHGYEFGSLIANSLIKSTINLDYELYKKHHIILTANYANIEDNLYTTGNWLSTPDYSGYALGYSLETFLGPIEGKYSWSPETKKGIFGINIGFWF